MEEFPWGLLVFVPWVVSLLYDTYIMTTPEYKNRKRF